MTLYAEILLEHGRAPRNEGPLAGATSSTKTNPLCGDRATVHVRVEAERVAATFEARGCLLARASASLLTEAVSGATREEARAIAQDVIAIASGEERHLAPSLEALGGVRAFPARRACVTLAWAALLEVLARDATR
jgi:nitrogen fixation protein NifU and related proteins